MIGYIIAVPVLVILYIFLYEKAYSAKISSLKEFLYLTAAVAVMIVIYAILVIIYLKT